jgi:hypothetical protein
MKRKNVAAVFFAALAVGAAVALVPAAHADTTPIPSDGPGPAAIAPGAIAGLHQGGTRPGSVTGRVWLVGLNSNCIDIQSSDGHVYEGTPVIISQCSPTNERWTISPDNTIRAEDRCLDVADGSQAAGAPLQMVTCGAHPTQEFHLIGLDPHLRNDISGRCVDVSANGASVAGAQLTLQDCRQADSQIWDRSDRAK